MLEPVPVKKLRGGKELRRQTKLLPALKLYTWLRILGTTKYLKSPPPQRPKTETKRKMTNFESHHDEGRRLQLELTRCWGRKGQHGAEEKWTNLLFISRDMYLSHPTLATLILRFTCTGKYCDWACIPVRFSSTMVTLVTMGGDLQPGCLADRLLTGLGQPQINP